MRQFLTNVFAIAGRELGSYFKSFFTYVVLALFLVVIGAVFSLLVLTTLTTDPRQLIFDPMYLVLLLMTPLMTMRLIAEERRTGTIELILTSPVRDWELVLGKFLGGMGFFSAGIIGTLFYPAVLLMFAAPDPGILLSGYLGVMLFAGATVSIGLLTSTLTSNQIVAAASTFALLIFLGFGVIESTGQLFGSEIARGMRYAALYTHFNDFGKGVLETPHVVYFLSLIAVALFIATRALEASRWR